MSLLTVAVWCDRERIQFNEWKMRVFCCFLSLPYLRGKEEGIGFDNLPGQVNAFHILP
jgi:hypothetical protein